MNCMIILYVKNQKHTTEFYSKVLNLIPTLDVPGMTEFTLLSGQKIGFMPEKGIQKIINHKEFHAEYQNRISRAELYLLVDEPQKYHLRSIELGGIELQPLQIMPWGDEAAYSMDADGHILVFSKTSNRVPSG